MKLYLIVGSFVSVFLMSISFGAPNAADEYVESFETLTNIHAGGGAKAELEKEIVRSGKHSLKVSMTVNPQDGLVFKQGEKAVDLSNFNAISFWFYPDVPDGSFAIDVRICVWDEERKRGRWFTVGHISHHNAPNRKWSRHCFYIGGIPRDKVLRVFDIVAWHHSPVHSKGEKFTIYLDDLRIFRVPLSRDGVLLNGGFEREIIPWRITEGWRRGKIEIDFLRKAEGKSSVRIESPEGKPSPMLVQTVKVNGGEWYEIRGFVCTEKARGAQVLLSWWRDDGGAVMRTYPRIKSQVLNVDGTYDFKPFQAVFCAPEKANRCTVTLHSKGGVAWFDGLALQPIENGSERLRWLFMPPKQKLFWRERAKLPILCSIQPVTSVRIAFRLSSNQQLAISLQSTRASVPLVKVKGDKVIVCDGGRWHEIPFLFRKGCSLVICADAKKGKFGINVGGIVLPWRADFQFAQRINSIERVAFIGDGMVSHVLIEGPLWQPEEFDERRRGAKRMQIVMRKGVGWVVTERDLPEEFRVDTPPHSPWVKEAVILHTGLPFKTLLSNLKRIRDMGFNTLCLRPIQPTGHIGFGSSCCIQDYFALSRARGTREELLSLIKGAHKFGMRVIFWLVPNHASPSNEVFYKHPEFLFADAGIPRSQWFDVVDLDYANPDVWKFMVNVAEYWIREFDFDGFGIDVPDLIPRNFFRYMKHRLIKAKGGDVFILGESSGNGIEKWGMDCRYGFLSFFQMKEIFEGVIPPPKPPQRVISHLVKRLHPNETWEAFGPLGANYGLKRHIETYGDALTKCSAVIMTTLPFVPEVFAGMEIFEYRDESSAIGFMIKMLNLRQRHSALRSHNVQMVEHDHPEIACAYLKHARNEIALVIVNFRKSEVKLTLSIPTNAIAPLKFAPVKDLLTGKPVRLEWVGKNEISIKLPPFGVVLYVAPLRGKNYAVLSTVPHFTQSHPNTCGASALAMLLCGVGLKSNEDEILKSYPKMKKTGFYIPWLWEYAKKRGLKAKWGEGKIETVKEWVSKGVPVIVYQFSFLGEKARQHFRVVIGYDESKKIFICHDPAPQLGACYKISYEQFEKLWNLVWFRSEKTQKRRLWFVALKGS